ncbi:Hypothetical predicted protein [Paramuricea clavata]|uniref:Uncharacterized protein n=1 Tax=Paramuricea clavata TaxID=317549 RepID=A0A7D9LU53_PARCT|nr:Hypothetical predicted protein [Paramuricea clavata]
MLNLKTLRCLKDTRTVKRLNGEIKIPKQFSMEQCNKSASEQKWVCPSQDVDSQYVRNNGTGNLWEWIKPTDASYFQKCPENIYSYKGCYRFSDGNHTKLINKARCDTLHNGTCGLKIQAPIDIGYTSCQLDWTKSTHTISGFLWYPFDGTIAGVQLNATLYPVTLQIKNISFLLSTWKGHLLRLNIKCTDDEGRSESHCALLKVEGTATEEIPVSIATRTTAPPVSQTTSQITSQPGSTMFEYHQINMSSTSTPSQKLSSTNTSQPSVNSQDREENKDSSVILPIVIAAVALFCLLLALVVIVIVCKRRKRKNDDANQNEEHIYEEPHPVDNGPASPIYMEIDDITRSKSKKSNSSKKRNKSQSSETPPDPLYHTLEKPDRVEINSKKSNSSKKRNKSQSSETPPDPLYNTLEKPDHVEINDIYEALDDAPKSPNPTPQPFEKELDV